MKILAGLLALISGFFTGDSPHSQPPANLNTAVIAYHQTYFAPAVAEPGNFPWAKKAVIGATSETPTPLLSVPVLPPVPMPSAPPPPPPPTPADTGDPYIPQNITFVDQSTQWLKMDFSLNGNIYDNAEHSLSNITMDREYWKVDVFAYWAPGVQPPRPPLQKDYFKLEIYDEAAQKLIYTVTSGDEENIHKSQVFKKAGKYTFKAFAKTNGSYEINFFVSPKIAQ